MPLMSLANESVPRLDTKHVRRVCHPPNKDQGPRIHLENDVIPVGAPF